jgi:hypothetical protein
MRASESDGDTVATHRAAPAASGGAAVATAAGRLLSGANELLTFERGEEGVDRGSDVFRRNLKLLLKPDADFVARQALLEKRPHTRTRRVQLEDPVALEMDEHGGTSHIARNHSWMWTKLRRETGTLCVIHHGLEVSLRADGAESQARDRGSCSRKRIM